MFRSEAVPDEMNVNIAKVDKLIGHLDGERQQTRHWPSLPINGNEFLTEKDQAATLSVDQFAGGGELAQVGKQTCVGCQGFGVKFRIAATEVERMQIFRK